MKSGEYPEPSLDKVGAQKKIWNSIRLSAGFLLTSAALTLKPSSSKAYSKEEANTKLNDYGLPPSLFVPPGFNPLVSEYGRGNIKNPITNPIVVQFCYPQAWIVQKTSVNNNGESGTISANGILIN